MVQNSDSKTKKSGIELDGTGTGQARAFKKNLKSFFADLLFFSLYPPSLFSVSFLPDWLACVGGKGTARLST